MKTLYLRNVPHEVVERLQQLADRDGTSLSGIAVTEFADVSRRAGKPPCSACFVISMSM